MKMLYSYNLTDIMAEEATVRGLKNPNNSTIVQRNPLARTIRSAGFRTRIVKSKKGKGSYKRKGSIKRLVQEAKEESARFAAFMREQDI